MTRFSMPMVLCALVGALVCVPSRADDPPKKLTPEARKELEAKWKELNDAGAKAYRGGRHAEVIKAFEEALRVAQKLYPASDFPDGHIDLALARTNLGLLYQEQGRYADAEPLLEGALATCRSLYKGDHADTAAALHHLGSLFRSQGRYADAEPPLTDALAMRHRLFDDDQPYLADSLNDLGLLYRSQGRHADAESLLRDALAMTKRLFKGDHPKVAAGLNNLALSYRSRGQYAEAESLYKEALAMYRRLYKGDHPNVALTQTNLGLLHDSQRRYADAETLLKDALDMYRRLFRGDHPTVAAGLNNLGLLYKAQGKYADAEPILKGGLAMSRRLSKGDHYDLAAALTHLAAVYRVRGEYADAAPLLADALAMDRRLTARFAREKPEGETLTLLASRPRIRDEFLSNAPAGEPVSAGAYAHLWSDKGAVARAYEVRQQRARAADPRAAVALGALGSERRRRAELLLAAATNDPATRARRAAEISACDEIIDRLSRELAPLLPAVGRADKLAAAQPGELQQALAADAAVVDFLRFVRSDRNPDGPDERRTPHYVAFVLTRDKVACVQLGTAARLEPAIGAWRAAITSGKEIPPAVPARVRELVWEKVRKELPAGIETVYVSPDATLCKVPWGAIPGDKPGTILLEDFALATIPHAPFLLDKLWPQDERKNPPTDALVVGGVKYEVDPAPPAANPNAVAGRGDPLLKPGQKLGWSFLENTAGEAGGVSDTAARKKLPVARIEGDEATPSAVLAALPKAKYAHLATHGFFADPSFRGLFQLDEKDYEMRGGERVGRAVNSPLVMTGLVFAGANDPKTPGRGIVTGEQLIDLDLSGLELAVLSACETGLGDVAGGEGAFGLQRAFHYAGTRNVVCSLWKVPDESTAALMALFYRNLWDKDLPPMESLRQAQLEIYRNPQKIPGLAKGFRGKFELVPGMGGEVDVKPTKDGKAHPLLWAAFTLSGPGR